MKFFVLSLSLLTIVLLSSMSDITQPTQSIYNLSFTSIEGKTLEISSFKGKKILFVNVASKCGFTPQYEGLQKLYEQHKDSLVIIGFPCNQFAQQEKGTNNEIQHFCKKKYDITFLMSQKIDVKGEGQHPIYKWLTSQELNGVQNSTVRWNFQKYLVDEHGAFVNYWYAIKKPGNIKI